MAKPITQEVFLTKQEKLAAIRRTMTSVNKANGQTFIEMASDMKEPSRALFNIPVIDKVINGLPYGNFYTFWGAPKAGKTTLALYLVAQAQREGKVVGWIALEPFDKDRAVQFGVNTEELVKIECPKAENSLDILIDFARRKLVDVVILDSIHSLAPKKMFENKAGENKSLETDSMGLLASKLSEFFKIAIDPVKRSEMLVFLIGQTRKGLGGIVVLDILTGGNALIHNSRCIGHVRRGAKSDAPVRVTSEETDEVDAKGKKKKKRIETVIGFPCVIKLDAVQISNCAPEQTIINLPYYFESGFDYPEDIKKEIAQEEAEIAALDAQEAPNTEETDEDVVKPETPLVEPKKRGRKPKAKV